MIGSIFFLLLIIGFGLFLWIIIAAFQKTDSVKKLKERRAMLGLTFLASILILYGTTRWFLHDFSFGGAGSGGANMNVGAIPFMILSFFSTVGAFVGVLSTTILAWRREKRETISSKLEIEKKELEVEKLKIELNEYKTSNIQKPSLVKPQLNSQSKTERIKKSKNP